MKRRWEKIDGCAHKSDAKVTSVKTNFSKSADWEMVVKIAVETAGVSFETRENDFHTLVR